MEEAYIKCIYEIYKLIGVAAASSSRKLFPDDLSRLKELLENNAKPIWRSSFDRDSIENSLRVFSLCQFFFERSIDHSFIPPPSTSGILESLICCVTVQIWLGYGSWFGLIILNYQDEPNVIPKVLYKRDRRVRKWCDSRSTEVEEDKMLPCWL